MPDWRDPDEAAWAALDAELDAWAAQGRQAVLWWRDDDAVSVTPALDRLLDGSRRYGIPLALAVIPRDAVPGLDRALPPSVIVLQHGWAHLNHAAPGEKKAELGDHRPLEQVAAELDLGWSRLVRMFGVCALPVLVPPWNRIGQGVAAALPSLGFGGLSTFGPRPRGPFAPARVNTHVDIIDWRRRCFAGTVGCLETTVSHLSARRLGHADGDEPVGLLTHHLVHDDESWAFLDRFFARTRAHPAVTWASADRLFGSRP
jgi:hypothetical protein